MLQLFPFLLFIFIIVIITIVFFLFSHYLTLVSDYFYLSLLSIFILLLLYLFSSLLFISHFKFISVPFFFFFFPFLPFLSFCASKAHHVLHLQVIIFSFIPTGLLKILREERQDPPNYRQNSSPFPFAVVLLYVLSCMGNFILSVSPPFDT